MTTSPAPLLHAQQARVDVRGVPQCQNLSVTVDGSLVVMAGLGASALAAAITMTGRVVAGTVRMDGHDVTDRGHVHRVGVAPHDPALPRGTTVLDYVALSFRLSGLGQRDASRLARRALGDLAAEPLASRRTESLAVPERRVVIIAQAMLPETSALFVELPAAGLEGTSLDYVLAALKNAAKLRRVLCTAHQFTPPAGEHALAAAADHVVVLSPDAAIWSGTPAELFSGQTRLAVKVRGEAPNLVDKLTEMGFSVSGEPPRLCVELREGVSTSDIFAAAELCDTVVVEMIPLIDTTHRND